MVWLNRAEACTVPRSAFSDPATGRLFAKAIDKAVNSLVDDFANAYVSGRVAASTGVAAVSEESAKEVKPNFVKKSGNSGYLIWDPSTIKTFRAAKRIKKALTIPVQKIAVEQFGNIVYGNTILFGAFTVLSGIFSEESAIETIKKFVPPATLDTNLKAFELGKQEANEFKKKLQEEGA